MASTTGGPPALALAILAGLLLSGCVAPAETANGVGRVAFSGPDPTEFGAFDVAAAAYDLGVMQVSDPAGRTYTVRLVGEVRYPAAADGPLPVVVFLHGRHAWCEGTGGALFDDFGIAHCRGLGPVVEAVPSHLGHVGVAEILASQGFIVLLPDLNDINAGDSRTLFGVGGVGTVPPNGDDGLTARNQVLLRLLDELGAVGQTTAGQPRPLPSALGGIVDLERIGLVGHSRGAEAVTFAPAFAAAERHWAAGSIRAVFSIAGTPRPWMPDYPELLLPAGVAYASVVPYCDGDVSTLGNLEIHDRNVEKGVAGPLTQFVVMGANHNFYNTEWPQDDAEGLYDDDPFCSGETSGWGAGRMMPEDQVRFLAAYVPAFMRFHLADEAVFAPLFSGAVEVPAFACPGSVPCPGRVHVSYASKPADRVLLAGMAGLEAVGRNELGGEVVVEGDARVSWCASVEAACGVVPMAGASPRLRLGWNDSAFLRMGVPVGSVALGGDVSFVFRVAVDAAPGEGAPRVAVWVEDARGREHRVDVEDVSGALFVPPGTVAQRSIMNQVRVPLSSLGVAVADVRAVSLQVSADGAGAMFLGELAFDR